MMHINDDYFENAVLYYKKCFSETQESIVNFNPSSDEASHRKRLLEISLSRYSLSTLQALYSSGCVDKRKLQQQLNKTTDLIDKFWKPNVARMSTGDGPRQKYHPIYYLHHYIVMRWVLSFCVLLDAPVSSFEMLKKIIDRDKIEDALYDFLLSYKYPERKISQKMAIKKPVNRIKDILHMKQNSIFEKELAVYLDKEWLKTYKNSHIYNSHKAMDVPNYSFTGYWAFEVAAIVKIKGLDDSSFRDHKYYPSQLL